MVSLPLRRPRAKAEPGYRFYQLYDKVWRADILRHAYDLARANRGAPGVDGMTFGQIEASGLEDWLTRLGEELRTKTYQCQPVETGDDPEARRRRAAARYPDDPGPCGADRGEAGGWSLIFEADLEPAAIRLSAGNAAKCDRRDPAGADPATQSRITPMWSTRRSEQVFRHHSAPGSNAIDRPPYR